MIEPLLLKGPGPWGLWAHGPMGTMGSMESMGAHGNRGAHGSHGAHGTMEAIGPRGPSGRAGGGNFDLLIKAVYFLVSRYDLFLLHLMLPHALKVNPKEIPNLLVSSTYIKAGPMLIERPVYIYIYT